MGRLKRKIIPAFISLLFLTILFNGCKSESANPRIEVDRQVSLETESESKTSFIGDEELYFVVEYHNSQSPAALYIPPVLNSTRTGDFMVIKKRAEKNYLKPMLGIRVFFNGDSDAINPAIGEDTFTVAQDQTTLRPKIRHYDDKLRLADLTWILDPGWREIRIDQNVQGVFKGKPLETQADFWLDIQDGDIQWERTADPPSLNLPETPYCLIHYYYHGTALTTYVPPFERCTRQGDYMEVKREPSQKYLRPILAILIFNNKEKRIQITEKSFSVYQDGKYILPSITRYENDPKWLAEIRWEFDPDWKNARIDQEIFELAGDKLVKSDTRFKLDIQDGDIDWKKTLPRQKAGLDPKSFDPCPP